MAKRRSGEAEKCNENVNFISLLFLGVAIAKGAKWVGNQHINRSTSLHSLDGGDPPSSLLLAPHTHTHSLAWAVAFAFSSVDGLLLLLLRFPQFFRSVFYEMVPVFIIFFIVALCASSAVILRANIQAVADFKPCFHST